MIDRIRSRPAPEFGVVAERYFRGSDLDLVMFAHEIAVFSHGAQEARQNGDPYIRHPESVALKLMELRLPADYACLGLLHDIFEDAKHLSEKHVLRIRMVLGPEFLVDLQRISKRFANQALEPPGHSSANYYSTLRDSSLRVQVGKMADRLDNLSDIDGDHISPDKRRRVKQTTRTHLLPLAQNILCGMNRTDKMRYVIVHFREELDRLSRG